MTTIKDNRHPMPTGKVLEDAKWVQIDLSDPVKSKQLKDATQQVMDILIDKVKPVEAIFVLQTCISVIEEAMGMKTKVIAIAEPESGEGN